MSEKRRLYFTKMHGAGNDYIYIDALDAPTSNDISEFDLPDLSRRISDRHFGVGSDGLITIQPSASADFRMRIFNADGSEAQMCGNGIRCVGKYLFDKGFTDKTEIRIETNCGIKILYLNIENGKVKDVTVDMGIVSLNRRNVPVCGDPDAYMIDQEISVDDMTFQVTGIGMGNPHGVIFVDKLTDRLVHHYGRLLEHHPIFPERANIEFVETVDHTHLKMRVWERGSGETLACGTGTCATVVAAYLKNITGTEVDVDLLGGRLHISYDPATGRVMMRGGAEIVADGVYYI